MLCYVKGGDGTSVITASSVSLSLRKNILDEKEEDNNITTDSWADEKGQHQEKDDMGIVNNYNNTLSVDKESKRSVNSEESSDFIDVENAGYFRSSLRDDEYDHNYDSTAQAKRRGSDGGGDGKSQRQQQQQQSEKEQQHQDSHGKRQFRISSLLMGKRAKIHI